KHRIEALLGLCNMLAVEFTDISLLHQALIHTSFANEYKNLGVMHNERLEFLGDAILDLIISEYVFRKFPQFPEGELTKTRAIIVCEPTLARCAAELGIGKYLLLGKGEASSGGRERISILADSFEAIIGAIYMDSGFTNATCFVLDKLKADLLLVERGEYIKDYKTLLQEVVQRQNDSKVIYEIINERGPDHDKVFEVAVIVNTARLGTGIGKSKKEAEQNAASQALVMLKIISDK
ncbi:MAG TPA: ribonuclease III, partial [Negativicutes bacterium]